MPDHVPLYGLELDTRESVPVAAKGQRPRRRINWRMAGSEQTVELLETEEIAEFIPVMKEIDFGDRFLLSMLHWCGIGRRSTPLDYWKVLLVRARGDAVGVSGLYRQPGMPNNLVWVGWFGIRPRFRREGLGTSAMYALIDVSRSIGCQQLWVYTGSSDYGAVCFYKTLGFKVLGSAAEWAPGRTMEDSDIVLRRML
jgi:GNAT superfamily N-acetyltransferase